MKTSYDLYGFLCSIGIMRNTEKDGGLDECCQRVEERTDDVT